MPLASSPMPTTPFYDVSLSLALSGSGAPARETYETALEEAGAALGALFDAREPLELLSILDREDDIAAAEKIAAALKDGTSELFVLGTGGSALGGRALADLLPLGTVAPRVRFLDNLDHHTFETLLGQADLTTTRFLAISKSGGTAETMMQTLLAADAIRRSGDEAHLGKHFAVVTEPKPSALRRFAEDIGCPILDHPLGIGGRYSVLSVVGLLPAIILGLNARAIRKAARAVVSSAREGAGPAAGAALHVALSREGRLRETVLWPYSDRFLTFGAWWRQLWGESLGKEGKGSTPVAVLGPVDQHSQLQLFLDGPGNALFTVIDVGTAGQGPVVPAQEATRFGLGYLAGKSMGDLVAAEARATAEALARRGRSVRVVRLKSVDEAAMGALFMHFMLETILVGQMSGVDPFDQPAVEEGKILARAYLEQG